MKKFFIGFFKVPDFRAELSGWESSDASCFTGELPVISTSSSSSSFGVASGLMPFFGVKKFLMLDLFSAESMGMMKLGESRATFPTSLETG